MVTAGSGKSTIFKIFPWKRDYAYDIVCMQHYFTLGLQSEKRHFREFLLKKLTGSAQLNSYFLDENIKDFSGAAVLDFLKELHFTSQNLSVE